MFTSGFFRKSAYQIVMAIIYLFAGILLIVKSQLGVKDTQLLILGGIISLYGIYRLSLGLRKKAVSDEN